jgi:DNA-binding CsgD family transcriptional regulator
MAGRALLTGPDGTVRDLVARVLGHTGLAVEAFTNNGAGVMEGDEDDVLVVVSPGPQEWDVARRFEGGVVLVTERRPGDAEVVDAVLSGADAVVHPDDSPAELAAAVIAVSRGATILAPHQVRRLVRAARQGSAGQPAELRLTPREVSILASAERGESVKQTARFLGISPKTVENLQSRLFRKLGARNRAHAVVLAHRVGLLPEPDSVDA